MRSILVHATHLYMVLAVLAGVPAGESRAVLCVAASGHVAIEAGEGRCGDFAPTSSGGIANRDLCTGPDGCGDCVDLPVGKQILGSAHHVAPGNGASLVAPALEPVGLAGADRRGAMPRFAFAPVASARAAFAPPRTTILRI